MCRCLELGLAWLGSEDLEAAEQAILEYTRHVVDLCPECGRQYAAFVRGGLPALRQARAAQEQAARAEAGEGGGSALADPRAEVAAYLEGWRWRQKALRKAEQELADLLPLPPAERKLVVERANRRFRSPLLVEVVLARVRERIFEEAADALALAELAVAVAENLPRDRCGARPVDAALARALAHLGNALRVNLDLPAAEATLDRALELACQDCPEDRALQAEILSFMASLRQGQGRSEESLDLLDRAIGLHKVAGDRHLVGRALVKKAKALSFLGRLEGALAAAREAQKLVDPVREPLLEAIAQEHIVYYLARLGRGPEAQAELEAGRPLFARFTQARFQPRLLAAQGLVARAAGDLAAAERTLAEAWRGYLAEGAGYDAADVAMELAKVLVLRGDPEGLRALAREMHEVFQCPAVHAEVRRALTRFQEAAFQGQVTLELLEALSRYLERARYNPELRFELAA